jgi:predicted porin
MLAPKSDANQIRNLQMIFSTNSKFTAGLLVFASLHCTSWAQQASSVSLYGAVDASIGVSDNGAVKQSSVFSSASTSSRWGIRVREDLGGGLTAIANLEGGFSVDTGAQTLNRLFGRTAIVGLSSAVYGDFTIGRQLNPQALAIGPHSANQAVGPGYWGIITGVVPLRSIFTDNSIAYRSPSFGGMTLRALASTGYDAQAPGGIGDDGAQPAGQPRTGRQYALSVGYATGPLSASAAFMTTGLSYSSATAKVSSFRETSLSGSYDFNAAKLYTGFYTGQDSSISDDDRRAYWLGATVPVGAGRIGVQLAKRKDGANATPVQAGFSHTGISSGGRSASATVLSAYYDYALSKRTALYASYAKTKNSANGSLPLGSGDGPFAVRAAAAGKNPSAFSLGMRHVF